jgi:hypothetical protein
VNLDVAVESAIILAVRRRLVKHHHVREGHAPEVVEANQRLAKDGGEVDELGVREGCEAGMCLSWGDERLVRIAREVGNERERLITPHEEPAAVLFLGGDDVLKEGAAVARHVFRLGVSLVLDGLEDEVRPVDLAMRVRIAHSDNFALILEDVDVLHFLTRAEVEVLLPQHLEQVENLCLAELRESEVVHRSEAHDA